VAEPVVEFRCVSKAYPVYRHPGDRLKELLTLGRASFHEKFWALREVSFAVERGETFCILGENGSGKSTLLQVAAGIAPVTSGQVRVGGRVAALLELGAGFNPEFTGRDNVYLNAAILGFSRAEIDRRFPLIEQFAEIGAFVDQPVKTYSSGMLVRLAFSVAIHVDPEILLVDEALAVGDVYFRQRCMRRIHELRARGVTILLVSHATSDVKALGDRALWLDAGAVREIGPAEAVVSKYLAAMLAKDTAYERAHPRPPAAPAELTGERRIAPEIVEHIPNIDHRFGDGRAEILGIAILDEHGAALGALAPDTAVVVRISVRAHGDIAEPNVGFMMRNHLGQDFAGTNTTREGAPLAPMRAGDVVTVDFHLRLPALYPSSFSFSPAVADGPLERYTMCDWIDNAIVLEMMRGAGPIYGYLHLPCRVAVNQRLSPAPLAPEPALG
jgi:lipopolysaccharide transport system ATP-binding protein